MGCGILNGFFSMTHACVIMPQMVCFILPMSRNFKLCVDNAEVRWAGALSCSKGPVASSTVVTA
jgi:hypothetical protein